jgi:O-antigen chain-terminating methyltransferase
MLRTISELNASFQHRATLTEDSFRKAMLEQHSAFGNLLGKAGAEIQERLWADLREVRAQYEKLIYDELRVVRQRALAATPPGGQAQPRSPEDGGPQIDWLKFADRFRGSEERIRAAQAMYVERFRDASEVLDLGCGRGEFLEAAKAAGIGARGIDVSAECVALCRAKGLDAEHGDLFTYLAGLPDKSLGGVYCSQVIEHLPPHLLPEMIRLIGRKLRPGAPAAFETPNPECLAIYATHFYLDPTHTRPVPAPLLAFHLEENGFGEMEIRRLSPAADSIPALGEMPAAVREALFGGLDYALFARKL